MDSRSADQRSEIDCRVRRLISALLITSTVFVCGCGPELPPMGTVQGQLTLDGKPMNEVFVNFMPDPEFDTPGGMSSAVTDENGRYALSYVPEEGVVGAVVGKHRVVLNDLASENFRGAGRPPAPRVPSKWMNAGLTPIRVEVKPGEQQIDIDLSEYK